MARITIAIDEQHDHALSRFLPELRTLMLEWYGDDAYVIPDQRVPTHDDLPRDDDTYWLERMVEVEHLQALYAQYSGAPGPDLRIAQARVALTRED